MTEPSVINSNNEKQARNYGMLCHLTALVLFLGVPFGHLIGPLVVWLLKKNDHPFVDEQGKEALNFQISMTIYALVSALFVFVVVGIFFLIVLAIVDLILVIVASVKISNGQHYRYPLTIRFLK